MCKVPLLPLLQEVCKLLQCHLCLLILQGGAASLSADTSPHSSSVPHLPASPGHSPDTAPAAGHWPGPGDITHSGQDDRDAELRCSATAGVHTVTCLLQLVITT